MGCGQILIGVSLVVVLTAYLLYTPFPDDAVDASKQMKVSIQSGLDLGKCDILEYIGYSTFPECVRTTANPGKLHDSADLSDNDVQVTEQLFDGVKVRLYEPRDKRQNRPLPALVFYHGGGWVGGSVEQYDSFTRTLSKSVTALVVSVEYRLAPEFKFPIPFQDCLTATKYFMKNARKFGVDASRIAVAGDSAGGNLAMAVGTKLTQERQPPRLLGLIYPALQMADFKTPSYNTYTSFPFVLKTDRMVQFFLWYVFGKVEYLKQYLENQHITEEMRTSVNSKVNVKFLPEKYHKFPPNPNDLKPVDKNLAKKAEEFVNNVYICPLMLEDEMLSKLPKTYLMTCEYDPLREDGLMLAKRWKDLDFPVKHVHWDGVQHGFLTQEMKRSVEAVTDFVGYLREEL
ncbi:arylacetamide deacetylase-like isoform X2 [Argopecten irradians]